MTDAHDDDGRPPDAPRWVPPPPPSSLPPGIPVPSGVAMPQISPAPPPVGVRNGDGIGSGGAAAPTLWYRLSGYATALAVLFGCSIAASVFLAVAVANRLSVITDIEARRFGFGLADRARSSDDLVSAAGLVFSLVFLVTAVVLVIWLFRAAKNNEALGRTKPRFPPGWAIGGWFIPLGSLVIPVLLVQDLWRGSDASVTRGSPTWRSAPRSALVGWWWAAWVLSEIRFLYTFQNGSSLSDTHDSNVVVLVGVLFTIPAAVLAWRVVRSITARQEACREQQWVGWA